MLRLAFDFIITWRETRTRPNAYLQRVYVMSRYKQLTHKEIADKLEVSVQTVNYRIGKALQFFRIRLKDFCLE